MTNNSTKGAKANTPWAALGDRIRFLIRRELLLEAQAMLGDLRDVESAEVCKEEAIRCAENLRDEGRLATWKELTKIHRTALRETASLKYGARLIKRAGSLGLKDDEKLYESFLKCFKLKGTGAKPKSPDKPEEPIDLDQLAERVNAARAAWENVAATAGHRPFIFLTHSFLKVSTDARLETASLFLGGLVALGAIYMAFYYRTSSGLNASAYWTLEDLFVHGINVIPVVLIIMLFAEVVFFVVGQRWLLGDRFRGWVSGLIVEHSFLSASLLFVFLAFFTSYIGYLLGSSKLDEFYNMTEGEAQLATLTENENLTDAFLVGTTDRTAIFFQAVWPNVTGAASDNGQDSTRRAEGGGVEKESTNRGYPRSSYCESFARVASDFLPESFGFECDQGASPNGEKAGDEPLKKEDESEQESHDPSKVTPAGHRVMVIDRALIKCHAQGDDCLKALEPVMTQPPPCEGQGCVDLASLRGEIDGLLKRVEAESNRIGEKFDESSNLITGKLDASCAHMDRHYANIMNAVRNPDDGDEDSSSVFQAWGGTCEELNQGRSGTIDS